jgi:hypothetical protein
VLHAAGNQAVQRAARGGSAPAISPAGAPALQRCCGAGAAPLLPEALIQRQARSSGPAIHPASIAGIQRCCGGGGGASAVLPEALLQRQARGSASPSPTVHLPAGGAALDRGTRGFMERGFGRDLGGVRIHTGREADRAANDLDARAFTVGQDVYFANGEYSPGTPSGRRLLAHELTHTVQQAGARPTTQTALRVSQPGDPLEREADRVARQVVDGGGAGGHVSHGGRGEAQRQILPTLDDLEAGLDYLGEKAEEAGEAVYDAGEAVGGAVYDAGEAVGEAVYDAGEAVVDTIQGIAVELWDQANALADALGGIVSVQGLSLVIDVPAIDGVCPELAFQTALPELGEDIPLFLGALPIGAGIVSIYGLLSLHAGLTPEIGGQLGPCRLNGTRIVISPLGPSFSAAGSITVTTGLSLGGELRVGLVGEVGVLIVWPDPPFMMLIPVAALEAGLAGFARGTAVGEVTLSGAMSYSPGGFSVGLLRQEDTELSADLGLAGYGSLSVLGVELCRIYWPLLDWHDQMTLSTTIGAGLALGPRGASAVLTMGARVNAFPFGSLQSQLLRRGTFEDDCPLCDAFYALGWMPSQRGGEWRGTPLWGYGPLSIYMRDPGIPSRSTCRGACGPNCDTCTPAYDRLECIETLEGGHQYWVYPRYQECGSHGGCREHDAGYDWCAAGAGGPVGLLAPCLRLPDFECLCNYNAPQCVGWISGNPPHDSVMPFSDAPYLSGECQGPCPDAAPGPGGQTTYRLCLPEVQLFDRFGYGDGFSESTDDIPLFEIPIEVPYLLLPVVIAVYARGGMDAGLEAGIGPAWISNVCLEVDPYLGTYAGSGELHIHADAAAMLALTGTIGANASWGCLLDVVNVEGSLTAHGTALLDVELTDFVDVSCRMGRIVLDNSVLLQACLQLLVGLDAGVRVRLFNRWEVLRDRWKLASYAWGDCWDLWAGAHSTDLGETLPDFSAERLDPDGTLMALLTLAAEDRRWLGRLLGGAGRRPAAQGASAAPPAALSAGTGDPPDSGGPSLAIPSDPAPAAGKPNPCGASSASCPIGGGSASGEKVADSNIFMDRVEGGKTQRDNIDCNYLNNPKVTLWVPDEAWLEATRNDKFGTQIKRLQGVKGGATINKDKDGDVAAIPNVDELLSVKFGLADLKISLRAAERALPFLCTQADMPRQLTDASFPRRVAKVGMVVVERP